MRNQDGTVDGIEFRYVRRDAGAYLIMRVDVDSTADTLVKSFQSFMLACGYHPDSVREALGDYA